MQYVARRFEQIRGVSKCLGSSCEAMPAFPYSDFAPRNRPFSDALRARVAAVVHDSPEPVLHVLAKWKIRSLEQLSWMSRERCGKAIDSVNFLCYQDEGSLCSLRALNTQLVRQRVSGDWNAKVFWFEADASSRTEETSDALNTRLEVSIRESSELVLKILAAWNIHSLNQLSWMSPTRCRKGIEVLPSALTCEYQQEGPLCDLRKLNQELWDNRIADEERMFFHSRERLGRSVYRFISCSFLYVPLIRKPFSVTSTEPSTGNVGGIARNRHGVREASILWRAPYVHRNRQRRRVLTPTRADAADGSYRAVPPREKEYRQPDHSCLCKMQCCAVYHF